MSKSLFPSLEMCACLMPQLWHSKGRHADHFTSDTGTWEDSSLLVLQIAIKWEMCIWNKIVCKWN